MTTLFCQFDNICQFLLAFIYIYIYTEDVE